MNRTNYFAAYASKPPGHEDNLSRAFLALLRLVPAVQATFIDAIRDVQLKRGDENVLPSRTDSGSTVEEVLTQTNALEMDEGHLLSILLTDQSLESDTSVDAADRQARYDGVVHYADNWLLVLENKPSAADVWDGQLSPSRYDVSDDMIIEPKAVVLAWKDLIARLQALRDTSWLGPTQDQLIDDFQQYLLEYFPQLNPYPTLAACQDKPVLLSYRLQALMEALLPGRLKPHRGGNPYLYVPELKAAERVILHTKGSGSDWTLALSIYPGDTVRQARRLYHHIDSDAMQALDHGWTVRPNLHFAHINKHLLWVPAHTDLGTYVSFWREHREWIRKVPESEFEALGRLLRQNGLMEDDEVEKFDELFVRSNRSTVNVCPGIGMTYRWPAQEAEALDERGQLTAEVERRIRQVTEVWGAPESWTSVRSSVRQGAQEGRV